MQESKGAKVLYLQSQRKEEEKRKQIFKAPQTNPTPAPQKIYISFFEVLRIQYPTRSLHSTPFPNPGLWSERYGRMEKGQTDRKSFFLYRIQETGLTGGTLLPKKCM